MIKKIDLYVITYYNNKQQPVREWVEITPYIEQGITIDDSCDGTLDSGKFIFSVEEGTTIGNLNIAEPIPARVPVRIVEYLSEDEPNFVTQYIFETSDGAGVPLRTAQTDDKGNVTYIYSHEVNLVELTKELEGKYPPNLSVRQPKNIYNTIYTRSDGWTFTYNGSALFADNTNRAIVASSYVNDATPQNNETGVIGVNNYTNGSIIINTEYDPITDLPTTGIAVEDYTFNFGLRLQATAPQLINIKVIFGIDDTRYVYPTSNENFPQPIGKGHLFDRLPIYWTITARYYNRVGAVINTQTFTQETEYKGDGYIREASDTYNNLSVASNNVPPQRRTIILRRNANAAYVIITSTYRIPNLQMFVDNWGSGWGNFRDTNWVWGNVSDANAFRVGNNYASSSSGNNHWRVAFIPREYTVSISSSAIQESQLDSYRTLLDVATKALAEINLKQRTKYQFSDRLSKLMAQYKAPEATLQDYNLREILGKFGRIMEVIPILGDTDILDPNEDPLTTISFIRPGENTDLSFNPDTAEYVNTEKSNTLEEYYDVISARMYNTISEDDWHTEENVLQATEIEYSQLTQENAGFVMSYPIYWLRQIYLKPTTALRIPFTYTNSNGGTSTGYIRGNNPDYGPDDSRQTWNISDRCFEEDIYNALPDVNYITREGRLEGSLAKTNCVSYKSGETYIKNVGHLGPAIPDYDPPFTSATTIVPNLALVELCIVLAYSRYGASAEYPNFSIANTLSTTINDLLNVVAVVSYTTLNEFTYRNTSLDSRKVGKNIEHRANTQDKVSSYNDTTYYLRAEQNKQGNILITPTLIMPTIRSCLVTGVRVANNYIVTSRKLKIFNEYVEVSYELTKDFVMQNDNVKLDIEFERYAIPYDFVWREVLINTHVLLGYNVIELANKYGDDLGTLASITASATPNTCHPVYIDSIVGYSNQPSEAYGKATMDYFIRPNGVPIQDSRRGFIRFHLLKSANSISYIGRFVDNYSAGNQVWYQSGYNYVQPFRYCDALGKTRKLSLEVFSRLDNIQLAKQPDADFATLRWQDRLLNASSPTEFSVGDDKDAREGYEFNITASLEPTTPDILVYSASFQITHMATLSNDPSELNRLTQISDLEILEIVPKVIGVSSPLSTVRTYTIYIKASSPNFVPGVTPIALFHRSSSSNDVLKLILRNYTWSIVTDPAHPDTDQGQYYIILFSAVATRYGQWENV